MTAAEWAVWEQAQWERRTAPLRAQNAERERRQAAGICITCGVAEALAPWNPQCGECRRQAVFDAAVRVTEAKQQHRRRG